MSESINLRVVIFWCVFIFIFAGIGIFGAMNQDLLQDEKPDVYVPVVRGDNNKTCSATLERANIVYTYKLDENNKVTNVNIVYSAINGNIDDYEHAANLANLTVAGTSANIRDEINNFTFMLMVNLNGLDVNALSQYQTQIDGLNLVVKDATNYNDYLEEFKNKYTTYKCDALSEGSTVSSDTTEPTTQNLEG